MISFHFTPGQLVRQNISSFQPLWLSFCPQQTQAKSCLRLHIILYFLEATNYSLITKGVVVRTVVFLITRTYTLKHFNKGNFTKVLNKITKNWEYLYICYAWWCGDLIAQRKRGALQTSMNAISQQLFWCLPWKKWKGPLQYYARKEKSHCLSEQAFWYFIFISTLLKRFSFWYNPTLWCFKINLRFYLQTAVFSCLVPLSLFLILASWQPASAGQSPRGFFFDPNKGWTLYCMSTCCCPHTRHTVKKRWSRKLCYSSVVQIAHNLMLRVA